MTTNPTSNWKGPSLVNYKAQQAEVAKSKGVYEQLMQARTLTEARRIVYGEKKSKHGRKS